MIQIICYTWLAVALCVHIILFYVKAPFGRHTTTAWGPSMNNKWGWFVMELPSLLIMCYFLLSGANSLSFPIGLLFSCWIIHYAHRTIIYPLRIKPTSKQIPVVIVCSAVFFNLVNAGLNGYFLAHVAPPSSLKIDATFTVGMLVFLSGFYINLRSDSILIGLRSKGEKGYKIPYGFLFRYISSPNLFGEVVEWMGFALMAWNLPALTFMVWTYANLVPRAKNHHDWYRMHFADYPKERKIIFPFVY